MPLVRALIREFFGKEPCKSVHADEAVALGAAILADSLMTSEADAPVLLDVLPMSIGIGQPGGRFKRVIERNTTLPCRRTHSIWTSAQQGRTLAVPVFQGEQEHAQENEYLGRCWSPTCRTAWTATWSSTSPSRSRPSRS